MNAAEYKALQINKIIKTSDVFKTYQSLKASISQKYKIQEEELYSLQKEIVNLSYLDDGTLNSKKSEYLDKKKKFYEDPLIKSFIEVYKELNEMINGVKNIIESGV